MVNDAKPFSEEEISLLREVVPSATRNLHCRVDGLKVGGTWFEASIAAEAGFDLPRTVQVIKSVTSRHLHAVRPGGSSVWAPGYAAATVGEEMDAPIAAAKLASAHHRKESRA